MQSPANPQALNRYSYCLNNPLKYIDPTGHFDEDPVWVIYNAILEEYGITDDYYSEAFMQILFADLLSGNSIAYAALEAGGEDFTISGDVKLEIDKPTVTVYLSFQDEPFLVFGAPRSGVSLGPMGAFVLVKPGMRTSQIDNTIRHECFHNWEQQEQGFGSWLAGYVLEGALNMAHYDNWEEAFYNTSYESRARVYAGQEPGPAIKPWYQQIFDAQMRVYEEYGILPWWLYGGY